ncbi:MAG: protein-L-isoaspartate O-methyltransferase [Deltaproteobacteria bacterium CG11_big_fil_rev_8_21_14_0_20_47_16]|nr:MAG: protein-L-isoaspartate O-methyltransferase [Deltaproteobacteria bacterium CG11_big_fil_rev_8_21_14_0_20_47_16]
MVVPRRPSPFQRSGLTPQQQDYQISRKRMIAEQLIPAGVTDPRVLTAMAKIPRHLFVPEGMMSQAYSDHPLHIGEGQTISQPAIVGLMTQALELKGHEKVLDVGTGSGYQLAVLCELAKEVFSIERISKLSNRARRILYDIAYVNFKLRIGDGSMGWPEEAPFDAILVAAGSPEIPSVYLSQLKEGGRLVIPVGGSESQDLVLAIRRGNTFESKVILPCRFVKLIGKQGWRET